MKATITRDTKKLGRNISGTKAMYNRVKQRMHDDAVSGLVHAAEHGNATYLQRMFDYMPKAYQNAIKQWLAVNTSFEELKEDDETRMRTWLNMKKNKFFVVKGTADRREATASRFKDLDTVEITPFFADKDKDEGKPVDMLELLKQLQRSLTGFDRKVEKEEVELPQVLTKETHRLECLIEDVIKATEKERRKGEEEASDIQQEVAQKAA